MILTDIGKLMSSGKCFAVTTHVSPDGDAIGSVLGLYHCLTQIGKNVDVVIDDILPDKYNFLAGYNMIKKADDISKDKKYDCIFVLDSGSEDRIGDSIEIIKNGNIIVNIDHHITNTMFGDINYVDPNAASVGEIIYQLIKINGYDVSKVISECLYTSIITDTGGFRYSNTTSTTFNIAGDLINSGINFTEIANTVFDRKTVPEVKLLSMVMSTLELYYDNKVSVIYLTEDMLYKSGSQYEDAESFINIVRDIDTVDTAIFIKEKEKGTFRISLRSKQIVDVKDIAVAFGGGGHIRAAGCTIVGSKDEVRDKLLAEVKKQLDGIK